MASEIKKTATPVKIETGRAIVRKAPYRCYNQQCPLFEKNQYLEPGKPCSCGNKEPKRLTIIHAIEPSPGGVIKTTSMNPPHNKVEYEFCCEDAENMARNPDPKKHPKHYAVATEPSAVTCFACLEHLGFTEQNGLMIPPKPEDEELLVN